MNIIEKSESIRAGLRKGFQDGTSKMARRKCYGYDAGADGTVINPDEAAVVRWIFDHYLNGDSLGKIAAGLGAQGIPVPNGEAYVEPRSYHQTGFQREIHGSCISPENYQRWRLPNEK